MTLEYNNFKYLAADHLFSKYLIHYRQMDISNEINILEKNGPAPKTLKLCVLSGILVCDEKSFRVLATCVPGQVELGTSSKQQNEYSVRFSCAGNAKIFTGSCPSPEGGVDGTSPVQICALPRARK